MQIFNKGEIADRVGQSAHNWALCPPTMGALPQKHYLGKWSSSVEIRPKSVNFIDAIL